jgi:carboxyl-terminal processing protease
MSHLDPDLRPHPSVHSVSGFDGRRFLRERLGSVERRLKSAAIVSSVAGAFCVGVIAGHGLPLSVTGAGAESSLTGRAEFATLEQTWNLIHQQWADPQELDDSALIYGAAKGMVDAIGDTGHSAFLDPKAAAEFQQESEDKFVGIGVEVDARCGVPVVAATMTDSPARAAGLEPGDVISAVNGESTRHMTMDGLRQAILGHQGDKLTLTIERPGKTEPFDVSVVRQEIERQLVTWRWLPNKTVQLRITGFEPGVAQKVRSALQTFRAQGAQRLILDLRGNPGGVVPEVIGVASQFLDEGTTIFQEKGREGSAKPILTVGHDGKWLDLALVVLIDGQSASGAEVLAAALHDNNRAELVGETTFGTGTVLQTCPQPDGSSLVLGTAFWLTPKGEHIWQHGVNPDEFVDLAPDAFPSRPEDDPDLTTLELQSSTDEQLKAAFAALNGQTLEQK